MRVLRPVGIVAALAAPPLVLSALVWPDSTSAGEDDGAGKPFEQLVDDIHTTTVELDGATYAITLRPDMAGACLEVSGPMSGMGTSCGDLRNLRGVTGTSGSSGPAGSELTTSGLIDPEVESVEVELPDGTTVDGGLAELPGRPEKVFAVVVHLEGDAFAQPGGTGVTVRFLDGDGEVVEQSEL